MKQKTKSYSCELNRVSEYCTDIKYNTAYSVPKKGLNKMEI